MRLITQMVLLAAACLATRALADAPTPLPAPDAQAPPLSVWRFGDAGDAEHLQSGLACPKQFRGYTRIDLHLYDGFGLDVSCNYSAPGVILTVYLTQRSGAGVDEAMAEAKREFEVGRAGWRPRLISDTRAAAGPVAWHVLLYSDDEGRDGIWIADLDGWTLEYRITNTVAVDGQAQADMAAMTQMVVQSAGAHLDRCGRSSPPARSGVLIRDAKANKDSAMMGAILGSAILAAGTDAGKAPLPAGPVTWCVEQPLRLEQGEALFWRGVRDDGSDAETDRVTAMTVGTPPTLTVASDATANAAEGQSGRQPKWSATMADAEHTRIYGYFTGRPDPQALAALLADIVSGKAQPLIGFGVKGKSISIEMPSEK